MIEAKMVLNAASLYEVPIFEISHKKVENKFGKIIEEYQIKTYKKLPEGATDEMARIAFKYHEAAALSKKPDGGDILLTDGEKDISKTE